MAQHAALRSLAPVLLLGASLVQGCSFMRDRQAPDPRRLESYVRTLAEKYVPRDGSNPERLATAAQFIQSEFKKHGVTYLDRFGPQGAYANVVASFGPSPVRFVIGAHYDADGPHPGADDNASGVAGLLELARMYADDPPPVGVELVAFALEELPYYGTELMGSWVRAQHHRASGTPLKLMVSLEMIGYFSDAPGSQEYPHPSLRSQYPDVGNFIGVVGRLGEESIVNAFAAAMKSASTLPVYHLNAPTDLQGVSSSDHASYWRAGYAALMVTDTSYFRNPHYHTEGDRPETLDYERMSAVVRGVYAAIRRLSDAALKKGPLD